MSDRIKGARATDTTPWAGEEHGYFTSKLRAPQPEASSTSFSPFTYQASLIAPMGFAGIALQQALPAHAAVAHTAHQSHRHFQPFGKLAPAYLNSLGKTAICVVSLSITPFALLLKTQQRI